MYFFGATCFPPGAPPSRGVSNRFYKRLSISRNIEIVGEDYGRQYVVNAGVEHPVWPLKKIVSRLEYALEVEGLSVKVEDKAVLSEVDLKVPSGQVHVLFGPNGSGKSSLILTILGISRYVITSGRILFRGKDIGGMAINERVKLGLAVAFQHPPAIRGVKLRDIIELRLDEGKSLEEGYLLAEKLKISKEFLARDLNVGFSGGELKKSEVLQVLAQDPDFLMLDEPDSGVDVENLERIGNVLGGFLKGKSCLLVTHSGYILRHLRVDAAHVMVDGRIVCSGEPDEILEDVMEKGYDGCRRCQRTERKPKLQ